MLPSWEATLGWATRDETIVNQMQTGYPRFFIHRTIMRLAEHIMERFSDIDREGSNTNTAAATPREDDGKKQLIAMLFSCNKHAFQCAKFLKTQASTSGKVIMLRLGHASDCWGVDTVDWAKARLDAVLFPPDLLQLAKSFWQHTGFGISSRYAEYCLERICDMEVQARIDFSDSEGVQKIHGRNLPNEGPDPRHKQSTSTYVHGTSDQKVKDLLRQRISRLASNSECQLDASDVYLFSSGMSAISTVAEILPAIKRPNESRAMVSYGYVIHC